MARIPRLDNPQRKHAETELEMARAWLPVFAWWPVTCFVSGTYGQLHTRRVWWTQVARRYPKARLRWMRDSWVVVKGDPIYCYAGGGSYAARYERIRDHTGPDGRVVPDTP